jgi:hypothetical protein
MVRNTLSTNKVVVLPYPFLRGPTVYMEKDTSAVTPAVPVLPYIPGTVGKDAGTLAVRLPIPVLPAVLITVGRGAGTLAVRLSSLELPDILRTGGPSAGALTVCPTGNGHIGITRRQSALLIS